jgi:hypothetical protein
MTLLLAVAPLLTPFPPQQVVSLFQYSCVSLVELSDGRLERGWGDIRQQNAWSSINHSILSVQCASLLQISHSELLSANNYIDYVSSTKGCNSSYKICLYIFLPNATRHTPHGSSAVTHSRGNLLTLPHTPTHTVALPPLTSPLTQLLSHRARF